MEVDGWVNRSIIFISFTRGFSYAENDADTIFNTKIYTNEVPSSSTQTSLKERKDVVGERTGNNEPSKERRLPCSQDGQTLSTNPMFGHV